MVLSVRIDPKTRKLIDHLARTEGVSRSEVVRRGIHLFAEQKTNAGETAPYEAIKHLIGKARGGPRNLSERTGDRFRELLLKKRSGR